MLDGLHSLTELRGVARLLEREASVPRDLVLVAGALEGSMYGLPSVAT